MSLVEKDTKYLDYKKEAVFTTPLLEKKLFTTEKVTTSEEVHKRNKILYYKKEAVVMAQLSNKKY